MAEIFLQGTSVKIVCRPIQQAGRSGIAHPLSLVSGSWLPVPRPVLEYFSMSFALVSRSRGSSWD